MTTVWVTSLPRSFSSATMRVLAEGCGLTPFRDNRAGLPHQANPHGYYEHERLNVNPVGALRGLDLDGYCLKVFAKNVRPLLAAGIRPTHDIVLDRPFTDVSASLRRWFPRMDRDPQELALRLQAGVDALAEYRVPTLRVPVYELLDDPPGWCARISDFIGGGHDTAAMAALLDPALCHFRGGEHVDEPTPALAVPRGGPGRGRLDNLFPLHTTVPIFPPGMRSTNR